MLMAPTTPARSGEHMRAEAPERTRTVTPEQIAGFGHLRIAEIQRGRILAAMMDVAAELGVGKVSVAEVVERSGVSRRTFYELFMDCEDCFYAAFEQALADARDQGASAFRREKRWQEQIRAGLFALLHFFDAHPQAGRVLLTESLAAGQRTLARREETIAQLIRIVERGAGEGKTARVPTSLTAEGLVGGVVSVIRRRLTEKPCAPLIDLVNPLMSMIVLPYLGAGAARRELKRPIPTLVPAGHERTVTGDLFKGAGMRLTYRTVRVLMAIEQHPGASNRLIAEIAQITDQGQTSKVLGRLKRAGILTNSGLGVARGAPNEWTLTPAGRQLTESLRLHTEGSQSHSGQQR